MVVFEDNATLTVEGHLPAVVFDQENFVCTDAVLDGTETVMNRRRYGTGGVGTVDDQHIPNEVAILIAPKVCTRVRRSRVRCVCQEYVLDYCEANPMRL